MKISEIDSNFAVKKADTDLVYIDSLSVFFSLYGVVYDQSSRQYLRMPMSVAKTISPNVAGLNEHTSGGRIRFSTDSQTIAVKVKTKNIIEMNHMTQTGIRGFSVYEKDTFYRALVPPVIRSENNIYDAQIAFPNKKMRDITIYFPLYNDVQKLEIGMQKDARIKQSKPYKYVKPILFYGSSITQGGCASRPGNSYDAVLCRMINSDYINLGFSGSGKAEQAMCDYLPTVDASVFICDYDHNAPDIEYLKNTHFNLYQTYRKVKDKTPIVLLSRMDFDLDVSESIKRREVIFETYKKGLALGDKNLYFIDGEKLFGSVNRDCCTVDGCHPTDIGFVRAAENIYPVIKQILEK